MYYKKASNVYVLRLSIGEEVLTTIKDLCKKENILFATVDGIGAVSKATVGFFSLLENEYHSKTYDCPMEMVSLLGNITSKDSEPYLHLHASFSGEDCNVIGGHLNEAIIGVTAEIFIKTIDGEMGRKIHPVTGINVLDI